MVSRFMMERNVHLSVAKDLYQLDESANLRYSHENPDINLLYEEYFEKPNSHKAHMLLHTDASGKYGAIWNRIL